MIAVAKPFAIDCSAHEVLDEGSADERDAGEAAMWAGREEAGEEEAWADTTVSCGIVSALKDALSHLTSMG